MTHSPEGNCCSKQMVKIIEQKLKVRDPLKYQIKKANTERFKCSSVIYMQKLLNEDYRRRRKEMNDLNNKLSTSKKWIMKKSPYSQVNYVSNDYHCRK